MTTHSTSTSTPMQEIQLPMKREGYRIHLAAKGCKTFDLIVVDSISAF